MNKKTLFIFIVCTFILLSVPFLRFIAGKPLLSGDLPYYQVRLAQAFWQQGILFNDYSISGGRLAFATPYHIVLAFFVQFFSPTLVILVFTFILNILTFLFLASILKRILPNLHYYCLFLYSISIPVIATMASSTPIAFTLFLYVVSVYTFLRNKQILTAALFVLFSLHGPFENFLGIATLYFLSRIKKQEPSLLFFFLLFFFCAIQVPLSFFSAVLMTHSSSSIAEFGGLMSESLFLLLLSFIGIIFIWSSKKQHYVVYIFFFLLFLLSLFYPSFLPYANYFIVYLASHTFSTFTHFHFRIKSIKPLFFLFFFTSLLTEPAFFIHQIVMLPPEQDFLTMLEIPITPSPAIFFSSPDLGFFISAAGHIPIIDNNPLRFASKHRINALYHDALNARELSTLTRTFTNLNVTHVLLTPEHEQQYPRFAQLLTNNETFKSVHTTDSYRLYEYAP